MRPSAPWAIIDIDLAEPLPNLCSPPTVQGILILFRYEGAVLGYANLFPENLPLGAAELALVAARSTAVTIAELLLLGPHDGLPPTPQNVVAPPHLPEDDATELLGRLSEALAERRARPVRVTASVVICTRKRPQDLLGCLDSIAPEITRVREVVVVDNGPDPETAAAVRAFPSVRYVAEPQPGLSRARNAGIAAATGDIAVFIDDDVRPEPGWIEPLLRRFDAEDVGVVCGLVLPEALETEAQIGFQYDLRFGGMGPLPLCFDMAYVEGWRRGVPVWNIGAGANMAVRRKTALKLGGFDERIGPGAAGGCGDDSEFWHRLLFAGGRAIYEPLSVVRHRHRTAWPELERQAFGYSFGHVVALFAQYARDGDRGDLLRALVDLPAWLGHRALSAPRRSLRGQPDTLLFAWIRGYLAGLAKFRLALRERQVNPATRKENPANGERRP